LEDRRNRLGEIANGVIRSRTREVTEIWDVGVVEDVPMTDGQIDDFTKVGTAFKADTGRIRMVLKKGIALSGAVELRKQKTAGKPN